MHIFGGGNKKKRTKQNEAKSKKKKNVKWLKLIEESRNMQKFACEHAISEWHVCVCVRINLLVCVVCYIHTYMHICIFICVTNSECTDVLAVLVSVRKYSLKKWKLCSVHFAISCHTVVVVVNNCTTRFFFACLYSYVCWKVFISKYMIVSEFWHNVNPSCWKYFISVCT